MSESPPVEVFPDPAAVALRAAEAIREHARTAIAERDAFTFAVSGGRTPWVVFAELARSEFPWGNTAIYQVDERVAPPGSQERNLTHLRAALPAAALARVHPLPVEAPDLDAAASRYARELPERLDLIHLGLGPDGHTASLIPGDPVLDVVDRDVGLSGPYQGCLRMTITYPVIERARSLLWVVTGADKLDALRRLRAHDPSIPAGRIAPEGALVLADASAVGD
ncbi:MAG TPA: 6-phosphogluconolactonase [Solirubrobacteraceae bacterium]